MTDDLVKKLVPDDPPQSMQDDKFRKEMLDKIAEHCNR